MARTASLMSLGRLSLLFLICSVAISRTGSSVLVCAQESDDIKSPIESITVPLKQQFDALPPKGKFATGAFVGFAATRVAIKTTTGILKIAGATFVA